jgi:hypothetical protein
MKRNMLRKKKHCGIHLIYNDGKSNKLNDYIVCAPGVSKVIVNVKQKLKMKCLCSVTEKFEGRFDTTN